VTIDERIEGLVKASEQQGGTIDRILAGMDKISENFREFQEDRNQINRSMATLIERVDKLAEKIDRQTDNVDRLEKFFERSLTKPPNGKTKGGK
jgi:methyl-accepting chemotaxis protein